MQVECNGLQKECSVLRSEKQDMMTKQQKERSSLQSEYASLRAEKEELLKTHQKEKGNLQSESAALRSEKEALLQKQQQLEKDLARLVSNIHPRPLCLPFIYFPIHRKQKSGWYTVCHRWCLRVVLYSVVFFLVARVPKMLSLATVSEA